MKYGYYIVLNLIPMLIFRQCLGQIETVSALKSVAHYSAWVDVGNPVNSTELLEILPDKSWNQCIKDCKMRPGCAFANYHQHTHLCYILRIIDINVGIHITNIPGYMYAEKTEFDMVGYEDCQVCTEFEVCDTSLYPVACHVTSCRPPVVSDDIQVLGNINRIESSVVLRCNNTSYSQMTSVLTCSQSGNWTESNFTCNQGSQPAAPITTSEFVCQSLTDAYRTVLLSDGTTLTYKVVTHRMLSLIEARIACGDDSGHLMRVTTRARMVFIQALTQCSGFPSSDIWVSGEYDSNTNEWQTWDGSTIPLTEVYWVPGKPDYLNTQHCARLEPNNSFYLDNFKCQEPFNFICEKVNGF